MPILEGATNFNIDNSVLNDVQGDATFFQLFSDGVLTEIQLDLFKKHVAELQLAIRSPDCDAESIQKSCDHLCRSISVIIDDEGSKVADALRSNLLDLWSELSEVSKDDGDFNVAKASREIGRKLESFLSACRMTGIVRVSEVEEKIDKELKRAIRRVSLSIRKLRF